MLSKLVSYFRRHDAYRQLSDEKIKQPLLYISYGMPKSGSTLAFEITKRIFELNGHKQVRLSDDAVEPGHDINFVENWTNDSIIEALLLEARQVGSTIVIKTHTSPSKRVEQLIASGDLIGHCICRDPRDIALSLRDHGHRSRQAGNSSFGKIVSLEDTLARIDKRLNMYLLWAKLENFPTITYENMLCRKQLFADIIEKQMGFTSDIESVYDHVNRHTFTQLNKGVLNRYDSEMNEEEKELFSEKFQKFIDLVNSYSTLD